MNVNMIVAVGKDGSIGRAGQLIWHISEDLRRFKSLTMGHPVIMGRKTWESLPKRPLPGRRNIVVSRNAAYEAEGAEVVSSPEEAMAAAGDGAFVMGGSQLYDAFMPFVTKIYLTEIDAACPDADAHIDIRMDRWKADETGEWTETPDGVGYSYVDLSRAL